MSSVDLMPEEKNKRKIQAKISNVAKFRKDLRKFVDMIKGSEYKKLVEKMLNRKKIAGLSNKEVDNGRQSSFLNIESCNTPPRVVVYTCITNGYDTLLDPAILPENVTYIAFLDNYSKIKGSRWIIKKIPDSIQKEIPDGVLANRFVKFHPNEIIGDEFDYSIYVDGNIRIVGDITTLIDAVNPKTGLALHRHRQRNSVFDEVEVCKILKKGNVEKLSEQAKKYKEKGFPAAFGLYECNVIVSDLHNKMAKKLLDDWWQEFLESESMRDQIALPYVVWKNGLGFDDIGSLGRNVYRNPKFSFAEKIHEGVNE